MKRLVQRITSDQIGRHQTSIIRTCRCVRPSCMPRPALSLICPIRRRQNTIANLTQNWPHRATNWPPGGFCPHITGTAPLRHTQRRAGTFAGRCRRHICRRHQNPLLHLPSTADQSSPLSICDQATPTLFWLQRLNLNKAVALTSRTFSSKAKRTNLA